MLSHFCEFICEASLFHLILERMTKIKITSTMTINPGIDVGNREYLTIANRYSPIEICLEINKKRHQVKWLRTQNI